MFNLWVVASLTLVQLTDHLLNTLNPQQCMPLANDNEGNYHKTCNKGVQNSDFKDFSVGGCGWK